MYFVLLYASLYGLSSSSADWGSEWMSPVKNKLETVATTPDNGVGLKLFSDDVLRMVPVTINSRDILYPSKNNMVFGTANNDLTMEDVQIKLEDAIENAKTLADTVKVQISAITVRENKLKEAITSGRSGVTVVTVSTIDQSPRSYIIRDNYWTLCNGLIQTPVHNRINELFNGLFNTPRCIGQEVTTTRDPCVFNSVIKYEIVPSRRRLNYYEDDYLCLRETFNNTLERYMSVPKQLINGTCTNGTVKRIVDNTMACGIRVLSEYTFYPRRSSSAAELPLEYCTEVDGSCNLIVAWHLSNTTIENFEFLQNDLNFKHYFLKSNSSMDHIVL